MEDKHLKEFLSVRDRMTAIEQQIMHINNEMAKGQQIGKQLKDEYNALKVKEMTLREFLPKDAVAEIAKPKTVEKTKGKK